MFVQPSTAILLLPHRKHSISIANTYCLMLFRDKIIVFTATICKVWVKCRILHCQSRWHMELIGFRAVYITTDILILTFEVPLLIQGRKVTLCVTFNNSTFYPHNVFMCFVWIWEQTAIISLYSINWLVFVTETECVYCAVRSTFYVLPTQCIYVFCVDLRTNSDYFTARH